MGSSLGRLAVVMARGRGAYNTGRARREQQDFENERELNRERLNEAFRRDQLEARRLQQEEIQAFREAQLGQQREQAEASRVSAMERLRLQMEERERAAQQQREFMANQNALNRDNQRALREMMGAQQAARGSASKPPTVTQGERQATALYQFAEPAAERMLDRYDEGKAPSTWDRFMESFRGPLRPDFVANWFQSDEGQQIYDDLTSIILSTQYAMSGKAVTENEARRLARGLLPQPGDKPGRAAQKRGEIENRMRVLRTMAGRGLNPDAPEVEPETMDDLRNTSGYRPNNPFARNP